MPFSFFWRLKNRANDNQTATQVTSILNLSLGAFFNENYRSISTRDWNTISRYMIEHPRMFLRKSLAIFGYLQKSTEILRNVRVPFGQFLKSLEIFGRWTKIVGKSSNRQYVYIIKYNRRLLADMENLFSRSTLYLGAPMVYPVFICTLV